MIVYGTFDGFKNYREAPNKFIWKNVVDEMGNQLVGHYFSEKDLILKNVKMSFGNRYRISGTEIIGSDIMGVSKLKEVNKNPRCDVFRKFKDEYHIISGKYKGKKDFELTDEELINYCIWLGKNTTNEATIKNILEILNKKTR